MSTDKSSPDALFGNPGGPAAPAVPASTQAPNQPAVASTEGDAPLPGHAEFRPSRSHVPEPITITPAPAQTQVPTQQPGQQPTQVHLQLVPPGQPGQVPAAPVVPQQQVQQPMVTDPATGHQVPIGVMLAERAARQAAEDHARQVAVQSQEAIRAAMAQSAQMAEVLRQITAPQQQAQQPEAPISYADDPDGWAAQVERNAARQVQAAVQELAQREQQREQVTLNRNLNASQAAAEARHTKPMVDAAYAAAKAAGMVPYLVKRDDPYGACVDWYQGQVALQQARSGQPVNPAFFAPAAPVYPAAPTYAMPAAPVHPQMPMPGQPDVNSIVAAVIAQLTGGRPLPSNIPPAVSNGTSAVAQTAVVPSSGQFFNQMFTPDPTRAHPARAA